jgi:hypothetical protein
LTLPKAKYLLLQQPLKALWILISHLNPGRWPGLG